MAVFIQEISPELTGMPLAESCRKVQDSRAGSELALESFCRTGEETDERNVSRTGRGGSSRYRINECICTAGADE